MFAGPATGRLVTGDLEWSSLNSQCVKEGRVPSRVRAGQGGIVSDRDSRQQVTKRHRPTAGQPRLVEVDPERIVLWVNGFAERHGVLRWSVAESSVALSAADGATAVLEPFAPGAPTVSVDELPGWAAPPTYLALILVRRGGYAVGLGQGSGLVAHKVGTRYVQSRTAAGGWSQHRFARRRDNQADALVGSVIEHTRRIVLASPSDALVVGGDKVLVRDVLADARLSQLAELPRRELFDLPDPKLVVLQKALRRGRAVRIMLSEPSAALES